MIPEPGRGDGWHWPVNAKKAHYFESGRSACGRWLFFGIQEDPSQVPGEEPGRDDCRPCWKKAKGAS